MAMSKKDFIALADEIRRHNKDVELRGGKPFSESHLETLASFCKGQNNNFMRDRWLGYVAGENGPCGGTR